MRKYNYYCLTFILAEFYLQLIFRYYQCFKLSELISYHQGMQYIVVLI